MMKALSLGVAFAATAAMALPLGELKQTVDTIPLAMGGGEPDGSYTGSRAAKFPLPGADAVAVIDSASHTGSIAFTVVGVTKICTDVPYTFDAATNAISIEKTDCVKLFPFTIESATWDASKDEINLVCAQFGIEIELSMAHQDEFEAMLMDMMMAEHVEEPVIGELKQTADTIPLAMGSGEPDGSYVGSRAAKFPLPSASSVAVIDSASHTGSIAFTLVGVTKTCTDVPYTFDAATNAMSIEKTDCVKSFPFTIVSATWDPSKDDIILVATWLGIKVEVSMTHQDEFEAMLMDMMMAEPVEEPVKMSPQDQLVATIEKIISQ